MRWCSAFPASQGCLCAGILTWGVVTSPHFERQLSISSVPWPFPMGSNDELALEDLAGRAVSLLHSVRNDCFWGSYKLQLNGMTRNMILCVERRTGVKFCERCLGQFFFFHPFFLIHLASGKECMQVACMIIKCQIRNQLLVPWKPQQVSDEKKSEFNCKAELHRRAADLLSVKCQYQCNKDGTQ